MYANKKKNSFSKVVVLLLCLCLLIGGVIGGTIAYLMDSSEKVVNTFVAGDIGHLGLTETDADKKFMVIPGVEIEKDPTVTFYGNNVDAYVFVTVEQEGWVVSSDGMSYSCVKNSQDKYQVTWMIAPGWKHLDNGVYYREVGPDADGNLGAEEKYPVISGNKITVLNTITKEDLENFPTTKLTFKAYAIQKDALTNAAAAWSALQS